MDKTDNNVLSKYQYNEIPKTNLNKENKYISLNKKPEENKNKYITNYNIISKGLQENKSEININKISTKKIWEKNEVNKNVINVPVQTKKSELNIAFSKYNQPEKKTEIKQERTLQKNKEAEKTSSSKTKSEEKDITNKYQIKKENEKNIVEKPKINIKEINISKEISNNYNILKETPIKTINTEIPKKKVESKLFENRLIKDQQQKNIYERKGQEISTKTQYITEPSYKINISKELITPYNSLYKSNESKIDQKKEIKPKPKIKNELPRVDRNIEKQIDKKIQQPNISITKIINNKSSSEEVKDLKKTPKKINEQNLTNITTIQIHKTEKVSKDKSLPEVNNVFVVTSGSIGKEKKKKKV